MLGRFKNRPFRFASGERDTILGLVEFAKANKTAVRTVPQLVQEKQVQKRKRSN